MADQYDTEERAAVAAIITNGIRAHISDPKAKDALDYGCGTGLVGLPLMGEFRSLLLVDTSPRMIDQVGRKLARMQAHTAKALCCDFCTELPPLQVDIVFMAQVLHIQDTRLILDQVHTLLPPEGQLIIVDFDKDVGMVSEKVHNGFVQTELCSLVKQVGFSMIEAHTFYTEFTISRPGAVYGQGCLPVPFERTEMTETGWGSWAASARPVFRGGFPSGGIPQTHRCSAHLQNRHSNRTKNEQAIHVDRLLVIPEAHAFPQPTFPQPKYTPPLT